jgi:hypothetical protein
MLRHTVALFVLSTFGSGIHTAYAQDAKPYAGASAMLSTQGAHVRCPDAGAGCPKQGVEGTAIGVSGEVGTYLTPMLSLAFEASVPARFESTQKAGAAPPPFPPTSDQFSYMIHSRHRELIFSGLFHVHITPTERLRVEAIAGPSVVREDTLQHLEFFPFGSNNFGPERSLNRWTVGLTIGANLGVQVSRHVQFVPEIRLHWIERVDVDEASPDNSYAFLGLSSWVIRPAVGVRVGLRAMRSGRQTMSSDRMRFGHLAFAHSKTQQSSAIPITIHDGVPRGLIKIGAAVMLHERRHDRTTPAPRTHSAA